MTEMEKKGNNGRKGKSGSSDETLIAALEERLQWLLEEAPAEEVDGEKVDEIVRHLSMLKPMGTVEEHSDREALMRFHAYVRLREQEQTWTENGIGTAEAAEKMEMPAGMDDSAERPCFSVTAADADDAKASETSGTRKRRGAGIFFKIPVYKTAVAATAVLLIALAVGGSMGAANANRGNGFFYWLQRDDEGVTMITSPESLDGKQMFTYTDEYASVEEVPEEYQPYLIEGSEISQLRGYRLEKVTISSAEISCRVTQWFVDDAEEGNIYLGAVIYEENVHLMKEIYLSKEAQPIEQNGEVEEGMILRENVTGSEEGKFFFYAGNVKYFVEGNVDTGILKQVAEAYRKLMLGQ